jgi:hypothetical protein
LRIRSIGDNKTVDIIYENSEASIELNKELHKLPFKLTKKLTSIEYALLIKRIFTKYSNGDDSELSVVLSRKDVNFMDYTMYYPLMMEYEELSIKDITGLDFNSYLNQSILAKEEMCRNVAIIQEKRIEDMNNLKGELTNGEEI